MMMARISQKSTRAKWILRCTGFVALLNFIVFWVIAVCVGGDALNGYMHDGRYFICAHGACHEVSKDFWTYSYWHTISAMGGILLIFIEMAVLVTSGDIVLDFNQKVQL
jgi:hypothetical protein